MEEQIENLLSQMTLQEKVSLLAGIDFWHTRSIERLGIPSIKMTDGPHGTRTIDDTGQTLAGTCYPTGSAMAATWNTDLINRIGVALGEEAKAKGCRLLLGPCVNIHRSPLGGRNFESFAEDPYLSAQLTVAHITGVQSQGVGTCVKHFALNNSEFQRFTISSEAMERTIREIYLPSFEAAVKEAKSWTLMCSYNKINGIYASENHYFLTEILKKEWGFDGAVISDWGAVHSTAPSANAGLDMEMPGPAYFFGDALLQAVNEGKVTEETINDKVRRILRVMMRDGVMKEPGKPVESSANTPEHQALAREAAGDAIVLLKNNGNTLPLKKDSIRSLAVIGPNAAEARIEGGGSSRVEPYYAVSPLDGLKQYCRDSIKVSYELGCQNNRNTPPLKADDLPPAPADLMERAVKAAASADVALVFVGTSEEWETEGFDRENMELPGQQAELIERIAEANKKTIVVLNNGSPIAMERWLGKVAGIVEAWFPGQECGHAIADMLFGVVNPSGRLPVTFPRRLEDNPAFINYPGENGKVLYGEGIFVGYRYYDAKKVEPLFPFGYGLSYTTFQYSNLEVSKSELTADDQLEVTIDIKNTGKRTGKEVIQLYIHDVDSSLARPPKELKGFRKVFLKPGETKKVSFTLDKRSLSFYDPDKKQWMAEPGEFEVLVGSSSRDIRSTASFQLK
jgi:beta-glucosidase